MPPAAAAAPRPDVPPRRGLGGFTLVEVLVALAIVATAALAAQQAGQALLRTAERQPAQWLAQLCAHNAQVALRLEPAFPPPARASSPARREASRTRCRSPSTRRRTRAFAASRCGCGPPAATTC